MLFGLEENLSSGEENRALISDLRAMKLDLSHF